MAVVGGNLELKDIFEKERFPKSNWQFLSLAVYFPFGLILALLRFFIGFHACLVGLVLTHTPFIRSIVLRMLCLVLGINVEQDNKHERDKSTRVIVSNCVTNFDYIAFHLTTDCVTHKKWNGTIPINLFPGLHDFSQEGNILENLKGHVERSDIPVLFQPEETTSGKHCLLKFSTTAAKISKRVQPVAVTVERPLWANTATTILGTSAPYDLFWFLFSPYTVFKLRYLNVLHMEKDETEDAFTDRIQSTIAGALGFRISNFNAADKAEYEKRYVEESRRYSQQHIVRPVPPELLRMSAQVSEVLPYVPTDVILRDLDRTRSVGMTISNILEGVVSYIPLSPQVQAQGRPNTSSAGSARPSSDQPPKSQFPKSSQDRMSSFQERKAKMIAEARKRYIEKHGLTHLL
ncbi:lipid droplet-regulating VLDL assembly factor AUP1-like [Halyomorpha halys]|uniref:lipid droplet-regulating VLDL assembly factor AUP1-like n=1 Tax=Halyomorpha halys TaxID=286706 RepID=UPI0006D4C70D|nr:ancient ubiquitous protein 1-like [Halyomorpha halys]